MHYYGAPWITIKYWQLLSQVDNESMNLVYYFTPWGWQYQSLIVNPMGRIYCLPIGLTSSTHWLSNPWVGFTMSPRGSGKITSFTVKPMGWILYVPNPWGRQNVYNPCGGRLIKLQCYLLHWYWPHGSRHHGDACARGSWQWMCQAQKHNIQG